MRNNRMKKISNSAKRTKSKTLFITRVSADSFLLLPLVLTSLISFLAISLSYS
ncbi:hypothetical protein OIU77_010532 [Salix suchowensis]|uniref:Uncharacterized protein n=1 Tax=Salix suchowensis TaxID=1278906 RepID=A0ABQ9A9E3_9ROSI|nr:hypothetical protein OIU78_015508 [Salix suchowensis]KAJ6328866.1 hypothetical protein OIU77_010532 [Salix suchowensis]